MLYIYLYGLASGSELQKEIIGTLKNAGMSPDDFLVISVNSIAKDGHGRDVGAIKVISWDADKSREQDIFEIVAGRLEDKSIKTIHLPKEL